MMNGRGKAVVVGAECDAPRARRTTERRPPTPRQATREFVRVVLEDRTRASPRDEEVVDDVGGGDRHAGIVWYLLGIGQMEIRMTKPEARINDE